MSETRKDTRNPLFKGLKSLEGPFGSFDTSKLPEKPGELFLEWFAEALRESIPEPHAVTLSTVDEAGRPDSRTLILKDVQGETFFFASGMESRKGLQLQHHFGAAMNLYWPALGRQIRLRGKVVDTGADEGAEDFRRRSIEARAVALTGKQSRPLGSEEELETELAECREKLTNDPNLVSPSWRLYALEIDEAEFWQAEKGRKHTRVQYRLSGEGRWEYGLLWP